MFTFLSLFRKLNARFLLENRLRSVLTLFGIALGVAVLLAIHTVNHSAVEQFKQSIDAVAGKSNLEISPKSGPYLNESHLNQLRFLWDQDSLFTPVLDLNAIWPEGSNEVIQVLGVDMLSDRDFRSYQWSEAGEPKDVLNILKAGRVYLGEALAKRYDLQVDERFPLWINDEEQTVQVAGILALEGLDGASTDNLILMDLGVAQSLYQLKGQLSRIELQVPESAIHPIQKSLRQRLPDHLNIQAPSRRGERVEQMLSSYHYNLTALSFVALLVGMFLIYNTMSISVIRRRKDIGTLRALGLSRSTVFALFSLEALLIGAIGSLLGLGLGYLLSQSLVGAVSQTLQIVYTGQGIQELSMPLWLLGAAFLAGVLFTFLGALAPVLEATSVAPALASREQSQEFRFKKASIWLFVFGLVLTVLSIASAYQAPVNGVPVFGYISSTLGIFGLAFCIPFGLSVKAPFFARLLGALRLPIAKLAVLQLYGSLGRSSVAIASLMIAVGMMVSLTTMISSFRQTVDIWIHQSLKADLFIQPSSSQISRGAGSISVDWVRQVQAMPQIAAVDDFLELDSSLNGQPIKLGIGNLDAFSRYGNVEFVDQEDFRRVMDRVQRKRYAAVLSESLAIKQGLSKGDTVRLETPQGSKELSIEGIYYDYASEQGYLTIGRSLYQEWFQAPYRVSSLGVYLKPEADTEQVRQELFHSLSPDKRLTIRSNRELKAQVLEIFDNTFAITYAMQAIAIVVAILAVMNTLFALVLEGRKELGLLRYLGAAKQQLYRLVLVQAGLMGISGYLLGCVLGYGLSLLLVYVINLQSFGWSIRFEWPWAFVGQSTVLFILVAVASGLLPASMAAKTPAPQVIRQE